MKKILLGLFLLLFSSLSYGQSAIDSLSSIDQFGRVRDGIIAQNIINVLNTDPSGVKLTENEKHYIRTIVNGLYTIGVWQKCKAIYGFVGGNEWKHKWNWKDMRDLDVAYRAQFGSTISHSNMGIIGTNSTNTWVNTYIRPTIDINIFGNFSFIFYSNTQQITSLSVEIGIDEIGGLNRDSYLQISRIINSNQSMNARMGEIGDTNTLNSINTKGYFSSSRNGTTTNLFSNLSRINFNRTSTDIASSAGTFDNVTLLNIGTINGTLASTKRTPFCAILNDFLTTNENEQASHLITFAQGILNRQ
jgi:hypothetical protein